MPKDEISIIRNLEDAFKDIGKTRRWLFDLEDKGFSVTENDARIWNDIQKRFQKLNSKTKAKEDAYYMNKKLFERGRIERDTWERKRTNLKEELESLRFDLQRLIDEHYRFREDLYKKSKGIMKIPYSPIVAMWDELQKRAKKLTDMMLGALKQNYDHLLYVRRQGIEEEFEKFLRSDKVGFAIIGYTGYGKTNLICNLVKQYRSNNVVLLYSSPSLPHTNIKSKILEDLSPSPEFKIPIFEELLEGINEKIMEKEDRYFIVFIDAINEPPDQAEQLLKNINDMIACINYPRIKIVISCRIIIWSDLLFPVDFLYRNKFYTIGSMKEVELGQFSEQELKEAFQKYEQRFRFKTEFEHLSKNVMDTCRVPVMLRRISETYEGKEIPVNLPFELVYDEYYKKTMERDMKILLGRIVGKMIDLKADHVTQRQLAEDPLIAEHMADSTPGSAYMKLLDRGVLREVKPRNEVRFMHDEFFEVLLARIILEKPLEEKRCLDLLKQADTFYSLWGAIKTALSSRETGHCSKY